MGGVGSKVGWLHNSAAVQMHKKSPGVRTERISFLTIMATRNAIHVRALGDESVRSKLQLPVLY